MDRQTDRQTDRVTDRKTDIMMEERQTSRKTNRHIDWHTDKKRLDRRTHRQINRKKYRHTDRQTNGQKGRQTDRQTDMCYRLGRQSKRRTVAKCRERSLFENHQCEDRVRSHSLEGVDTLRPNNQTNFWFITGGRRSTAPPASASASFVATFSANVTQPLSGVLLRLRRPDGDASTALDRESLRHQRRRLPTDFERRDPTRRRPQEDQRRQRPVGAEVLTSNSAAEPASIFPLSFISFRFSPSKLWRHFQSLVCCHIT